MTNNTMKMFLRMLGIVWSTALTILVFAILLLKIDLVLQILTSTPVVAVVCIVFGIAVGFIAGAIVCFLNTTKTIDAKTAKIKRLQSDLGRVNHDYEETCKALTSLLNQKAHQHKKRADNDKKNFISMLQDFGRDFDDSDEESIEASGEESGSLPVEEPASEESDLQEEEATGVESLAESET